ncbi:MAG: sporulation protein YabP [Peptococcaceae bacterium]|jgi:sporulation protein YabP|nr:sporulation protein YabP [Peptococcaceae bacterium]
MWCEGGTMPMAERGTTLGPSHRLIMEERENMKLTGVRKVQAFEPKEITLETDLGLLSVRGERLGVKHLDLQQGEVHIEGYIDSLIYARQNGSSGRESLVKRIFR